MKQLICSTRIYSSLALGALLCAFSISTATADLPTLSIYIEGQAQNAWTYAPGLDDFGPPANGVRRLMEEKNFDAPPGLGQTTVTVKELKYDTDPLIFGNFLVQNNNAVPTSYVAIYSLPTVWPAPNSIRGSIDTSVIGTDAAVSAPVGGSVYTALIDNLGFGKTLQDAPFVVSTPNNADSASESFGWDLGGTPVTSSIGIELRFTVTPGDTAAIISDFEVVEVIPEPTTMALLLLGGSALFWRRRN